MSDCQERTLLPTAPERPTTRNHGRSCDDRDDEDGSGSGNNLHVRIYDGSRAILAQEADGTTESEVTGGRRNDRSNGRLGLLGHGLD